MVTLEQVKLLESKVGKAIDYVNRLTEENTLLKEKLAGYQQRIDELEVLIKQFKDDQGRIEDGILSALDRLNQFEDAIERGIAQVIPEKANKTAPISKGDDVSGEEVSGKEIFTETSPAEDSDEAIMAALEAEEKTAKERSKEPEDQTAELDIF